MITSVADFVRYFNGVRRRTWTAVDRIPPALAGWAPRPGELTCAAIVRHLAGAERFFVARVVEDRWTDDLDVALTFADLEGARVALASVHEEAAARLRALPDARLADTVADLEGSPVRVWRFLMTMVEHEVHHRSQLDAWLALAGTEPPQVFGYRMEDVVARARRAT